MNRRRLAVTLLLISGLLTLWLYQQQREQGAQLPRTPRHIPDYFLHDVTITTLAADGRPQQQLEAARLIHYLDDGTSTLQQPRLLIHGSDARPPWRVSAASGLIDADGSQVDLLGDVRIFHSGSDGDLVMTSPDLRWWPRQQQAQTDSPVQISGPRSRVNATGMRMQLDTERIRLLNQVRGIHEPAP